jgi:PHD/YefM family antitoxin component YafN of YafNO toxin-antitoxin module
MENSSTSPEIVIRDGKPVAVILSLAEYRELLEKAEDLEALRCLEEMRQKPLEFRRLDETRPYERQS